MNNDLTKRLIERKYNRDVDMNPEGLSLEQIKALELTAENWGLLAEIEGGKRKPRADVVAWANEQAGKADKEADLDKKGAEEAPDPTVTGQLEPGRENLELPKEVLHPETGTHEQTFIDRGSPFAKAEEKPAKGRK